MIIDSSALKTTVEPKLANPLFQYLLPIPAGRNDETQLSTVSELLIRDAHDMWARGYSGKVIFLGSRWDGFHLKHQYDVSGAELRKRYFAQLNSEYLIKNSTGRKVDEKQMIAIPRGCETINKFIALRRLLKESGDDANTSIAILAPDEAFGKRIDLDAGVFLDSGLLGKHTVIVMHHEKELDDGNREAREALLLERTKMFFTEMEWTDNPKLKDELMSTDEEALVRSSGYQTFLGDCDKILDEHPVTGTESPYRPRGTREAE